MAAITVEQLIRELSALPQEAIVVLAKDGEGNDFSPVPADSPYSVGTYVAVRAWYGAFLSPEDTEESGVPDDAVPAVCLWPTN